MVQSHIILTSCAGWSLPKEHRLVHIRQHCQRRGHEKRALDAKAS
jgi:hypothetical protein